MTNRIAGCALTIIVVLQLTACATVSNPPLDVIDVRSEPAGADAVITCDRGVRASGVTPTRLQIPRAAKGCSLTVSKEEMTPQTVELKPDFSNKFTAPMWVGIGAAAVLAIAGTDNLGVLIFAPPAIFGLSSAAIDAATGRHRTHDPSEIEVKLQRSP